MVFFLNSSRPAANASFNNTDMKKTDTECGSLKWHSTVTEDTHVAFIISGSRIINNDVTIPRYFMQISYSVFGPDYAGILNTP